MTDGDQQAHGPLKGTFDGSGVSRRGFLDWVLTGGLLAMVGAAVYPLIRFVIPPSRPEAAATQVTAAKVGELAPNTGKIFRFGKDPAILILTTSGQYKAFAATCTHLDCVVQFRGDLERIWCSCHNGHYDLNGNNVAGPPPSPLTAYTVSVRGDQVVVTRA